MMTGSLKKKIKKNKKGGCSVIRACSLIRSNTVDTHSGLYSDIYTVFGLGETARQAAPPSAKLPTSPFLFFLGLLLSFEEMRSVCVCVRACVSACVCVCLSVRGHNAILLGA